MSLKLASLASSPSNDADYPAIGPADLSKGTVELAIAGLIKKMTPFYFELMRETSDPNFEARPLKKEVPGGSLTVYSFDKENINLAKYYISIRTKVKELREDDPVDQLLIQLSRRMFSLGGTANGDFDFRLEKGYFTESKANYWHFDETFKNSITLCYSNREDWTTRVFNIKKLPTAIENATQLLQQSLSSSNKSKISLEDRSRIFEPLGEASRVGFLYDALNICHRAPVKADLGEREVGLSDYRLFIRFIDWK